MDRRSFLRNTALIGCSAAAHPLLSGVTFAAAPGDNRLVVIILRGAMDGLDVFQPYGDARLRKLRKSLSIGPDKGAHDLDGFFALHPALESLMPLWEKGELAFAPAVSTPYRDKRSHFDGQDVLEAGTGTDVEAGRQRDGWLNRLLQNMPNAESQTAYAVGVEQMLILAGDAPASSWAPQTKLGISPQAQKLLQHVYHEDDLFREAGEEAMEIAAQAGEVSKQEKTEGPGRAERALAAYAAARLNEETRIATFSIAGWDSHAGQERVLGKALARLSAAILTLKQELGDNWSKTTIMAMTEFGRTARENGSGGTDHGTGGALLMAGGAIKGGKAYGKWPGLAESELYKKRDLMPVADIRSYSAWALHDLFGTEQGVLEQSVFPGLDMGDNPGFLA